MKLTPKQFTEWVLKNDSQIKKLLRKQKKEIISEVCMEIASYSPLSIEKSEKLLKIIKKI